jgi:hypothetical protein
MVSGLDNSLPIRKDARHMPASSVFPPTRRGRPWIAAKVEELKATPGEARIVKTVTSFSQASPIVARLKQLGAAATSRRNDDGLVDVWACWEGE